MGPTEQAVPLEFTPVEDRLEVLANAEAQARERGYHRFPIVDVDAHHFELDSWERIVAYIEHPTVRRRAERMGGNRAFSLIPPILGDQLVAGRIKRRLSAGEPLPGVLHELERFEREMRQLGVRYSFVFPTSILSLGLHPQQEVENAIAWAYARWLTEEVLPHSDVVKAMLYLPFGDPEASLRMVERFAGCQGVVGWMVTSLRHQSVHHNRYVPLYSAIEATGMPLAFHPLYSWQERALEPVDRFLGVHALGFPLSNMVHLTNLVIHGIPERFPGIRFVWMECGVAWIPYLMLRLDNEYLMRRSEAPSLERKPSETMRDFYYTTQPLEWGDDLRYLEALFDLCRGATQFLWASDYPHWDFDLPSRIYDLPFLSEQEKRDILGGNALRIFPIEAAPGRT
jgi:predicted TIM-barrel fold metal-dependent hydrolase